MVENVLCAKKVSNIYSIRLCLFTTKFTFIQYSGFPDLNKGDETHKY